MGFAPGFDPAGIGLSWASFPVVSRHFVRSTTGYFAAKPPACRGERDLFAEISAGTELRERGRSPASARSKMLSGPSGDRA